MMYEPILRPIKGLNVVRILMTVCVLEFFGPWVKDYSESHVFNPDWVGHARVHMMWLLGFFLFSGIANLYLIWFARPKRLVHLYVSLMWLSANLLGFWLAVLALPLYDGSLVVPHHHVYILGIEENVFVFGVLSIIWAAAFCLLHFRVRPQVLKVAV
jgi:hypothetical protein